jgi:hypothetical protein
VYSWGIAITTKDISVLNPPQVVFIYLVMLYSMRPFFPSPHYTEMQELIFKLKSSYFIPCCTVLMEVNV